ncbi:helix-turn-helix domain-containing protein [Paenibacillus sp. PL91]|uniref:helix-turn-helix domain-containing protein n=1 Tax=Paenibacillus sp. PL91 TaxID=2729538 RepID=UPI00145FB2A2|nr:helix-turn-helix domain-containing protein [Paenibacillus sp. PL91]MBC9201549.1 AraC family transcriptional regulator [Paenibacillus sp. PL91]
MKRKVYKFWLYSYLFVLFIPILITLIVLLQSQEMLVKEVRRANDTLLDQVRQLVDNQITDIRRLGTQLSFDPRVMTYLNRETLDTAEARFGTMDMISSLQSYTIANGNITDAYIYLKNNDSGITTTTFMPADDLYSVLHKASGKSFAEWTEWLQASHAGLFVTLNEGAKQTENSLVYVQSLPIQEIKAAPATLVVLLNQERLKQAISKIGLATEGSVYILDREGHPIMITGWETGLAELPIQKMSNQSGFLTELVDGNDAAISYVKSDTTNWTYISVLPEQVYSAKVKLLKNLIYIAMLLCIGLGGLSAFWLTRRNYAPIQNMMNFVSTKVKTNMMNMPNEFAVLQSFMTDSAAIQDEASRKLLEQHQVLRNQFLARLLKGRVDMSSALPQAIESFDFRFETDRFAVMLLQIEDYEPLFQANQEMDAEKKIQFVYLIVTNIFEELLSAGHRSYFTEVDGMIACVVNVLGKEKEAKKELLKAANDAKPFIQEKFFVRFSVGVSDIHTFWSTLPKCYEEAVESLEYKLVLGSNQIISYESIKRPKNDLYYPLDTERQLINLMAAGNYDEAAAVLQRILITNFSEGTLSIQMGKLLMFELVGTMLKAVEQLQLSTKEIMVEKTDLIKQITECETFAEMEEEILDFLKKACDYLQQKKKSHNTDLKSQIVEHVLHNLDDMNISLTSISLAFDINPTYLSRFFKEQTGENLVDFVNKRRVDKVKSLLAETNQAIQDIAEQCGFASSQSLLRVFKKYEGITPGQYRQSRDGREALER